MRILIVVLLATSVVCHSDVRPALAEKQDEAPRRVVNFAERLVMIQLARAMSPVIRRERARCPVCCVESGALELAIGTIGISQTAEADAALLRLLGLQLDGAGAELLACAVVTRGSQIEQRLKSAVAAVFVSRCESEYEVLRKRELHDIGDVSVRDVCSSSEEFERKRAELIKAIEGQQPCDMMSGGSGEMEHE